jgi:hypothetical protein
MQWLSPINSAAKQHDIIRRKEEGTGQWFLHSAEYNAWQQGQDNILFCPGIPGAGKTMVAAIAIEHLCKGRQNEEIGVGYLFCSYKEQEGQTCNTLLEALLKQLTHGRPDHADAVVKMHETHQTQKTRPSHNEIATALQAVCSSYHVAYLVIDALDECTDTDGTRTKLLNTLQQLQTKANVRLMCTSRFIPEIEERFQLNTTLEVRASEQDVRQYVAGQVPRLPKCIQRDGDLIREVQDSIAKAVDGMYVYRKKSEYGIIFTNIKVIGFSLPDYMLTRCSIKRRSKR